MKRSLYDELVWNDIHGWLQPLWAGGGWFMRDDGVLEPHKRTIAIDTPWIHHGHTLWADCLRWHKVLFNIISVRIHELLPGEKPFVPSGCQECYKTVVRPRTVVELFALDELMSQTERPCKLGIEIRPEVEQLYGGYLYSRGLAAGRECCAWTRQEVDKWPGLGPDVPVILKNGCTEMELACGPSDQWQVTGIQRHIEALVDKWVDTGKSRQDEKQPAPVITRVKRRWLEFAAASKDMTYKRFTGGEPINKPYVTYHDGEKLWPVSMSGRTAQVG